MAYINKQDVLKAYKELSETHKEPERQGSKHDVSALRYVVALDRFFKTENRDCNTRDREHKTKFCEYVGEVCSVCQGLYTPNFYYPLNSHDGDFNVGSNLFSAGTVKTSLDSEKLYEYPNRKGGPIMEIRAGVLYRTPTFYDNINNYLKNEKRFNVAFVIWLLRNKSLTIDESNKLGSLRNALLELYTNELVDSLLPEDDEVTSSLADYSLRMSDENENLSEDDIRNLFDASNDGVVSEPDEKLALSSNKPSFSMRNAFMKFLSECTSLSKNFPSKYDGGLQNFVNERLRELVEGYVDIYDCVDLEEAERYRDILQKDEAFREQDGTDNEKYSTSLDWYIKFLRARKMFSSLRMLHTPREKTSLDEASRQQIYYGAPGAGKSFKVKEIVESGNDNFVRTTFHPDSDYSTFVGCYKPTMDGDRIVYKFVQQAFLQAYVDAWRLYAEAEAGEEPKVEYLVIEEINRGNCAQIFGDMFQLLDRNEYGFSDYFINADQDLSKHLSEELSEVKAKFDDAKKNRVNTVCKRNIVDKVLEGKIMLLPSNLYILATMNTSDQSLFPIDSAFKRRWDWVYVPIAKGVDKDSGKELEWKIDVGEGYDWWNFLKAINEKIGEATNSEDKKLGFFFCQAREGVIDTHTFVNKVLFYLWNDVFKDLGDEGGLFNKEKSERITFDMFHDKEKGVELVEYWIKKVMGIKDNEANTTPVPPDPANE